MPKKLPAPVPFTETEKHIIAAGVGWLELGNPAEARRELEKLPKKVAQNPQILLIWGEVYAAEGNWELLRKSAKKVTETVPMYLDGWIQLANATRHSGPAGIKKAEQILNSIYMKFLFCPEVSYTRALCAGQRGDYELAEDMLDDAFTSAAQKADVIDEFAAKALKAPELKPIWHKIPPLAEFNKTH